MTEQHPQTRAVRAGINTDPVHGAVVPPVYLSTTYSFPAFGEPGAYDYSRAGNPTRSVLADAIADLEGGAGGVVTASGMAAITTTVLALLPPGGTLVAPIDCYGGSWRLFDALARTGRLQLRLADLSEESTWPDALAGADLVWLETPSNPLLRITDIAALGAAAHAAGALVVADNTFASPVVQRPLESGADVVVHSATKYLNGHSDVVAGAIVAASAERVADLAWWANTLGATGGALDAYLALRGLRTLHLRMAAAQANAAAVVELLGSHPAVRAVHYPGLDAHPQHQLAVRQMQGFGAIVTFEVGGEAAVRALVDGLECFCLAESLGGVESLVSHPATMTHAAMPPDVQAAAGITDGMLRLSLGVEDASDLVADLRAGLDRAASTG
ncbi:MAG: cystathionine gamma-synthase [Propionibacteriaceae bacterium]|nr:cystathionine gamma-synthase [Propionibacteriaceae bacterium]